MIEERVIVTCDVCGKKEESIARADLSLNMVDVTVRIGDDTPKNWWHHFHACESCVSVVKQRLANFLSGMASTGRFNPKAAKE